MAKRVSTSTYLIVCSIEDSIKRVKLLATGETLELNRDQSKYLSQELQVTARLLQDDDARARILGHESTSSTVSKVLLQLDSVVKRAENLVQQCCQSGTSTWPKRALTLYAIKDDVLDIIIHGRWWTSILSMLIDIPSSKLSTPERVKHLNQRFEQRLQSKGGLERAASEDRKLLLRKVDVELKASNNIYKPSSWMQHGVDYLLLLQVRALLTDKDEHSTPQLNECSPDGKNALLGKGSFGVVHRVKWCGYDCVLKQYNLLKTDDIEVSTLKRFQHPHIVRFFRHWKDEDIENHQFHILMERMEKDLDMYIRSEQTKKSTQARPFSLPVAIDIMLQVINAIWHMHREGVVHRDLKPQNVLVRSSGENALSAEGYVQVKLGDFGTAKENIMTTNEGTLTFKTGTSFYRAPELASREYTKAGNRKFPFKIDMWSFGIMCSQIVSGQQPFKEVEPGNRLQRHTEKGGRPFIPVDCPDYLKLCIERCWEYDPEKRPVSTDMWRMLRVAQLRSLGLLDQNYDFFIFKDRRNKQASQIPPVQPREEAGSRNDYSQAAVNEESVSCTEVGRPHVVFHNSSVPQGLSGFFQGSLFNNI